MPKHRLIVLLLLSLLLAACQGYTPAPTQSAPTATETVSASQPPTAAPAVTLLPAETAEAASSSSASVGCTVESPFPTPGPTEQSLFPPPSEADWVKGPEGASVTFTEYSDFQ